MAQPITVSPITINMGEGASSLATGVARWAEMNRLSAIEAAKATQAQKLQTQKLYGDTEEKLQQWYRDAKDIPIQLRDQILEQGIQSLKSSPHLAGEVANEALKSFTGYQQYFSNAEAIAKEMEKDKEYDPNAVRAFFRDKMFNYQTQSGINAELVSGWMSGKTPLPEGKTLQGALASQIGAKDVVVKRLKSAGELEDPRSMIAQELEHSGDLYINRSDLITNAGKELDDVFLKATTPIKSSLRIDPTTNKTLSLGVNSNVSMFDRIDKGVNKTTGIEYDKPVLNTEKGTLTTGGLDTPRKQIVEVSMLADQPYNDMMKLASDKFKAQVKIGAIDKAKEMNYIALSKAGYPQDKIIGIIASLTPNNISSYKDVPGFVDYFDPTNGEMLRRSYAADLVKTRRAYKDNGDYRGTEISAGVDIKKPSGSGEGGGEGGTNFVERLVKVKNNPQAAIKILDELRGGYTGDDFQNVTTVLNPDGTVSINYSAKNPYLSTARVWKSETINLNDPHIATTAERIYKKFTGREPGFAKDINKGKAGYANTYRGMDKDGNPQ